jgi:DNA replication protein DnaC
VNDNAVSSRKRRTRKRDVCIELFNSTTALVTALTKAHHAGPARGRLVHYAKPKLLIVDELGYLPLEGNAAHLFFQFVSRRYERGSMLLTSNRAVSEWGTVFGDNAVATAILDRLLHHSHVITIAATATACARNGARDSFHNAQQRRKWRR